jgi:hypothetical protein
MIDQTAVVWRPGIQKEIIILEYAETMVGKTLQRVAGRLLHIQINELYPRIRVLRCQAEACHKG